MICTELNGLKLHSFAELADAGARNAVSTRLGGASHGPYASLNLGYSVGDEARHVEANRQALYGVFGVDAKSVVTCSQVHSTTIARVGAGAAGRGALAPGDALPATDSLITNQPGLVLFLRFADCAPLLIVDPVRKAIGLAHAGWKGTVGDIAGATVAAMTQAFGSQPRDMLAAVGPCVGRCHYAIGEDVAQQVREALPFWGSILHQLDGGLALDLAEANRRLLLAAGVPEGSIALAGVCTACQTDAFYSHRGEHGKTGRFGVLMGLHGAR